MTWPTLLTDVVFPIMLIIDGSCFSLQKKTPNVLFYFIYFIFSFRNVRRGYKFI